MPQEKRSHSLSIFLLKGGYEHPHEAIKVDACDSPIDIPISGYGSGQLFVRRTGSTAPRWAQLFNEFLDPTAVAVPGVSAALWLSINDKKFVLTFGQGGRFLLKEDVHEERFGLLTTLNSVSSETLRCVDVQSLDAIQSHSRIQAGQASSPDQFGLDVEQDMLKAVVGEPKNPTYGTRMTGSDSLSVSVSLKLSDLPALLIEYAKQFQQDISGKDYDWVNNIALTKSASQISLLETALNNKLTSKSLTNIWLAIPEILDWDQVSGFRFSHSAKKVYPDITLDNFLKTLPEDTPLDIALLKDRRVWCVDSDFKRTYKEWSVYRCLYAEVDTPDGKFILNDGSWFKVNADFVQRTNTEFKKIPLSNLTLLEYADDSEGVYNARVAASLPQQFALLDDTQKIMHGGGHGQVEVCDLFSINGEFVHVKLYGKSSVFSHLFAQGFVSGQLFQIDPEFRKKVKAKLSKPFSDLVPTDQKPAQNQFTIVYAVISKEAGTGLMLPFFSRVNANNTSRILQGYGFKVQLLKIPVNDAYAKTVKIPMKGKKH